MRTLEMSSITRGNGFIPADLLHLFIVTFFSLNVLVFINGTSPSLQSVLLSAHFDSVSTGYGKQIHIAGLVPCFNPTILRGYR